MKKFKIILTIIMIAVCASLGSLVSTLNVDAANNECSEDYTEKTYINNLSYSISGNTVSYSGARGLLYSTSFDATKRSVNNNGNFTFEVPEQYINDRIEVQFYLAESDGICESGKEIGSNTFYIDNTGPNQLYNNELCINYRNKWSNNKTMRDAVPYCFAETVSVQYSYNDVSSWISEAERLYQIKEEGSPIEPSEGYINVDNVKETDKLVCDAFSTNNYETMHKYSHKETNTTASDCTTTCVEEIEVNFSDPVATQAGMCFQYLIEIKSKVTCDNVYTAPKPSKKAVCYLKPYCISSNGYENTHGGPTEDFDACVLECDGGNYSQKCIDKCYTNVYEKGKTYSSKVVSQNVFDTIDNASILTFNDSIPKKFTKVTDIDCITDAEIKSGRYSAQTVYDFKQRYPGGSFKNNKWVSGGTCASQIGYYYFSTLGRTQQTINELTGNYRDQWAQKEYSPDPNGSGILKRVKEGGVASTCRDTCYWDNSYSCGSNTVLTEYIAEQEYQKELAAWESEKAACEASNATCTNEVTNYEIVVDNVDTDSDTDDDEETFSSSQKLNSTTIEGEFPDMVILATGQCEDGGDGGEGNWHYHNIITFPGTWVNNKTGQTVHSIEPGHEDFYTYVGNEYCTKLNSVPVNTAWYDWKVNQNGDSSVLTDDEKNAIKDSLEMNINGSIENYGYFGWDFDVSCFYAIGEPDSECSTSDPNFPNCDGEGNTSGGDSTSSTAPVDNYNFRSISLDNLFPNSVTPTSTSLKDTHASLLINEVESLRGNDAIQVADDTREVGFNWTCAATNLENPDYIVQPVSLINQIQALGDSIYQGNEYLDYHIKLTPETMRKVRNYNDQYDSYAEPTDDDANEVLTAGNKKTAGITVYRSYLLHEVLDSSELLKSGLIGCNNEDNGTCPNVIDTSTACYNEYMAQSSVLKGAK